MKTCVSGLNALFWGTKVVKHLLYSIGPRIIFGSVIEHFANLRRVKDAKLVFRVWMHNFEVSKLVKHSFYSIGPKMMSGTYSEHFAHLRHVKRCKTCVSSLNALFWGTKVAKHQFYSIGPKMFFGSVLEHFANLRFVERWKLVFRAWTHYFRFQSCEASILLHWIKNDIWECFGALH
jgi:GH24 family phage-related lysozyme (muramidase)